MPATIQTITGTVIHPTYTDGTRAGTKLYISVDGRSLAVPYVGTLPEGARGTFQMRVTGVMAVADDLASLEVEK